MRRLLCGWLAAALTISRLAAEPEAVTAQALNMLAVTEFTAGNFRGAELHLRAALVAEQDVPDPLTRASLYLNLAAVHRSLSHITEAVFLYRQCIDLRRNVLGDNHPLLIGPQRGLAMSLLALGKPQEAEQMIHAAVDIPGAPVETAGAHNDLARILIASSDFQEAETAALQARRTLQTAGLANTIGYAETLTTLSVVTHSQGRLAAALGYSSEAAILMEKFAGTAHPSTAAAWNNLAQVLVSLGRYSEAEPLFKRAIACWEHAYDPKHPDVASGLTNLASLLQIKKHYSEAETLLRRALAITEQSYGSNSLQAALILNNLASLDLTRHRHAEAEPLFARALAIEDNAFGTDHPATGLVAANLAFVLYKEKRYFEAEPLFARAVRIRERTFGPDDPQLAHLLDCYAQVLRFNQNFSEAASIEARANGIRVHNALRSEK